MTQKEHAKEFHLPSVEIMNTRTQNVKVRMNDIQNVIPSFSFLRNNKSNSSLFSTGSVYLHGRNEHNIPMLLFFTSEFNARYFAKPQKTLAKVKKMR